MLRKRSKGKIREAVKERAGSRDYKALKAAIEKMPLLKSLVTSLLKPEVLQPGEFYDRLARDIMEAKEEVAIYSPFTYKDRVEEILHGHLPAVGLYLPLDKPLSRPLALEGVVSAGH